MATEKNHDQEENKLNPEEFCDGENATDQEEVVEEIVEEILEQDQKDLFAEVEKLQQEVTEVKDKLIRSHADIENLRKRHIKELENAHKYSIEKFASELLAVVDSLEMGVQAAEQEQVDLEKIKEGSELTLKMLKQLFEKFDIEVINPEGQKFNPDYHQAMSMQPVEGYEPNMVVSVMQKGYKIADRLLRPAMVMVSK